jgi:hypothetical protein
MVKHLGQQMIVEANGGIRSAVGNECCAAEGGN